MKRHVDYSVKFCIVSVKLLHYGCPSISKSKFEVNILDFEIRKFSKLFSKSFEFFSKYSQISEQQPPKFGLSAIQSGGPGGGE